MNLLSEQTRLRQKRLILQNKTDNNQIDKQQEQNHMRMQMKELRDTTAQQMAGLESEANRRDQANSVMGRLDRAVNGIRESASAGDPGKAYQNI